jgi:hypothetical protein
MQARMRWIAAAEIAAMSGLILSFTWIWGRTFPGAFAVCAAGYFGIGILGHRLRGESLQTIGLRLDNWLPAMRNAAIVVVISISAALIAGAMLDSWHFPGWKIVLVSLPVSVIWATAQQYGLLCVFYRRSQDLFGSATIAAGIAAVLFAVFHLPNGFLMGVTLAAGAAACVLYRFQPNIIVIGVAHALISFTLYHALPGKVTANLRVGPKYYTIEADCQRNERMGKFTRGCANWRGIRYPYSLSEISSSTMSLPSHSPKLRD